MAGFNSEAADLPRLAADLHAAGVELGRLDPAHDATGRVVLAATRPPRRTGHLATTLTAAAGVGGVVFGSTARYWTFVHWGAPRRHIKARPFFPQALDRSTDEVLAVYAEHAHRSLDKIG